MRSNINEQKVYKEDRRKNHTRGRDMPHFGIHQIILGHPEVFTKIKFIVRSTLPFELQNKMSKKIRIVTLLMTVNIILYMHFQVDYQCNVYSIKTISLYINI